MRTSAAVAFSAFVLVSTACGARGPLQFEEVVSVIEVADSGAPAASTLEDGGVPGNGSGNGNGNGNGSPSDDAGNPFTGIISTLIDAGGVVGCGACVLGDCGSSISTCLADPTCATSLQCILTTCLAGGGGDGGAASGGTLGCVTGCAGGSLVELLPILGCITNTCGTSCGSVLGGLGGLP